MKGYVFYLEYPNKAEKRKASVRVAGRLGNHTSNVFARLDPHTLDVDREEFLASLRNPEGYGAVYPRPNSAVCWTGTSWKHLNDNCKRISEKLAREIHPNLFLRMEEDIQREKAQEAHNG